jgi:uncharacterized protein (DUF1330 family)
MKKGYWVVVYRTISDGSAVKAYATLAVPALHSFGGRFLTNSKSHALGSGAERDFRIVEGVFRDQSF